MSGTLVGSKRRKHECFIRVIDQSEGDVIRCDDCGRYWLIVWTGLRRSRQRITRLSAWWILRRGERAAS